MSRNCRLSAGSGWALLLLCMVALLAACSSGPIGPRGADVLRGPVAVNTSMQSEFKRAVALMEDGKYSEAVPLLESILVQDDRLPGVQVNLAIAYTYLGPDKQYYQKAEKALLRAIEIDSRDPVAYNQLGLVYRRTGRFEESKRAYKQAIGLDAKYTMPHLNMGILCDIYLQDLKCAIDYFEKYRLLEPAQAQQTELWLSDLRQRAGIGAPAAQSAPSDSPQTEEAKQ